MTKILQIHLLGAFVIQLRGKSLAQKDWKSQQTQTIAKILLANHDKVITSDHLIETLWPDDPPNATRSRLHVRISQLRNGLKDKKALLRTVHGGYIFELDDTCWLDIEVFQSLVNQGARLQAEGQPQKAISAYEQAEHIYRGDFLAEDLYADWTFALREFYRERYLSLLIELAESYAQQGRYRVAITRLRQALAQDSLRETIYIRLMLYHYFAGERAQALQTYDRCKTVLAESLGVTPTDITNHIAKQIKMGTLWKQEKTPRYPPPIFEGKLFEVPYALNEIPFMGREKEYAWLMSQWQNENKHVVLLEGESGVGKTRLLETFAGHLASQGVHILHTHLSISKHTPIQAISETLRSLLTEKMLSQLPQSAIVSLSVLFADLHHRFDNLPQLPNLSLNDERQRLQQAISTLAEMYQGKSVLLIIDDGHRLGPDSVEQLQTLSHYFKILISYRSEDTPADHPLRTIFGDPDLKLSALSAPAIGAIINNLSGQELPDIAVKLHEQSGGNPLFVVTLLQQMFETGQLYIGSNGVWLTTTQGSISLPATLRETIENRLQRLNRSQRRVFDYCAVIGGEFNFRLLQTAAKQDEDSLLGIIDELMDAGLIIEPRSLSKPEFMISHDRYTEVAYETIPAIRRKGMHIQVAQAIEAMGSSNHEKYYAALANHFDKAEKTEPATHYAALAGDQAAAQFTISEALDFYSRALVLTSKENITRVAQLLLARETLYDLQGDRQPQNEDLLALESISPQMSKDQQAEICLRRANYEWIMGNNTNAQQAVSCAIQKAQACNATNLLAKAHYLAGLANEDPATRIDHLRQAQRLAHEAHNQVLEGDSVRWLGNTAFWQNQYKESIDYLTQALSIHRQVADLRGELSALNNLGHVHKKTGELQQARHYFDRALQMAQKISDKLAEGVILTNLGELNLVFGDYESAKPRLEKAALIRAEVGNEEGLAVAETHIGNLFRQMGDYDAALDHLHRALSLNTKIKHQKQTCETLVGLIYLHVELGAAESAQTFLNRAMANLPDNDIPCQITTRNAAVELNLLLGEYQQAQLLGQDAIAHSTQLPLLRADVLMNLGRALSGLGHFDNAAEHFKQASEIFDTLNLRHRAVEPLAGLAALRLEHNELTEATALTEKVLQHINAEKTGKPVRLLWIYLTCCKVLIRAGDQRAIDVIKSAYTILQTRADTIKDEALRQSYLHENSENREIIAIWQGMTRED